MTYAAPDEVEDADGEDDFEEDYGCSLPGDGAEVDAGGGFEDFEFFVVGCVEDAAGDWGRSIVFDVGLGIVVVFLFLWCVHCE